MGRDARWDPGQYSTGFSSWGNSVSGLQRRSDFQEKPGAVISVTENFTLLMQCDGMGNAFKTNRTLV
jgi:hypothetical protein